MRIHHLAMRTGDVATLARFYAERLGLPVVRRQEERAVWLRAGDAVLMIERAEAGEPPVPGATMELVAFAVPAAERARRKIALAAAGIAFEAETAHTTYFRDPDGRRVALSDYPLDALATPD